MLRGQGQNKISKLSYQEEKEESRVTQIKNKEDLEHFLMSTDRWANRCTLFEISYTVLQGSTHISVQKPYYSPPLPRMRRWWF
jgi:hypothetical protein